MHKSVNNTIGNVYHLEQMVDNFYPYSQKQLGFDQPATIIFQSDENNASKMLGKTAYYDPENMEVVLYTDNRHPKDVMRSLSHELVHHAQNCRGDFTSTDSTYEGYAQNDPHLREMEREAYTKGNLIFRDFEDLIKTGKINIEIDFSDSGEPKMSLKEWKNAELNRNLMKKWGLLKEEKKSFPDLTGDGEVTQADILKGRGVKVDEAHCSRVEDDEMNEETEGEETYHYGEAEGEDDKELHDLIKRHATRSHIDALKRDMDYDEDHEDRREHGDHFREGMFSPNHYCVHHGGVQHEGQIKMAEAINHNFDTKLNKVTWYDMKLQDGTILEQVAAEDIQVTSASLAEEHHHRVEDAEEESGMNKQSEKDPADYTGTRDEEEEAIKALKTGKGLEESSSKKISVREAKQITRRIIERIRKEGK
jgi:hypothetical protein